MSMNVVENTSHVCSDRIMNQSNGSIESLKTLKIVVNPETNKK